MTDPAGAEQFHAVTDMISAGEKSAVRHCQQPRFGRDAEGRFELRRVSQPLVVGQPESHDAVIGVLPSQPRQLLGVISRAPPTRRHHHPVGMHACAAAASTASTAARAPPSTGA